MKNVHLLLIDPQNDFCDLPAAWRPLDAAGAAQTPALPVAGAHEDMLRVAGLIAAAGKGIAAISVTLDSHNRYHIAHPTFWRRGDGGAVTPFTPITAAQVRAGEFTTRDPAARDRALAYMDELERQGRYTLMVWPVHCETGSWGHNVHPAVKAAYNAWEDSRQTVVRKIPKGSNTWTENYSALQAEVPDPDDPATQMNTGLIAQLDEADEILVAGEASSHCVRATVEHLAANLPSGRASKITLVVDCMSAVGGFEAEAAGFVESMKKLGVRTTTAKEAAATFAANA